MDEMPAGVIASLRAELNDDALGIGVARPRLSWKVSADGPWQQSSYELELVRAGSGQTTGQISSGESVFVPWPFDRLRSRDRVSVRVRAWGNDDDVVTSWSDTLEIEAALLDIADWEASFITPDWDEDLSAPQPAPYLRHEFDLAQPVASARLYITALGVYDAYVNGQAASDHVLAPGWTSYDHRLRVQVLDVAHLLRPGRNAIGAILSDGWFRGRLGPNGGRRNIYGEDLALLAQLEIVQADGSTTVITSDDQWRATTGPIRCSDLYDGETYDARLELDGWATPGHDDSGWHAVQPVQRDLSTLFFPSSPPVRRTDTIKPAAISQSPSGKTIVDFGQNLVGRVRIRVNGSEGQTITLRHAEILEDGELCVRPLRLAAATDRYTLKGGMEEEWEPRFTFHGFRYAEVDGWPGDIGSDQIEAVVCHSDFGRVGHFESSDPLLNRLHENVVWSMRGNFLDVPTDCAQRDERLGWTGDVEIFAPTALFLYDVAGFLSSWLGDLAAEQSPDGRVPNVVPEVMHGLLRGQHKHDAPAAAWGDAAVIVPWTIFQRVGDRTILERQYPSMRAWVELVERLAGPTRIWDSGFQYGDWLDPTAPPDRPEDGQTDPGLVATAYFARSAGILAQTAATLRKPSDARRFASLHQEVAEAFRGRYLRPDGRMESDSATAYALGLAFELVTDQETRDLLGRRLATLVRENGYRISTGFVGTPIICEALCSVGALDVAYRLLMERECPSWLYPVTMGATTIWERWDSMLPDSSLNPGEMTSFNHYALGAVADWLHSSVAGLAPAGPGFRRIMIRPCPGGGLTSARASLETPYGHAEVSWRVVENRLEVDATVPPNTEAIVSLPGVDTFEVRSGVYHWVAQPGVAPEPLVTFVD